MSARSLLAAASLASLAATLGWAGGARAETFLYRLVRPLLQEPTKPKPADPDKPEQVPKSTEHYWMIKGKVPLTYSTRLFDLGLFPHTSFVVNGTLLGNSPYAYWATSNDSTVMDLCQKIYTLPGGPWECDVRYDAFALYQGLVITKRGDWTIPLDFLAVVNNQAVSNPTELFGGQTPQVYTINKY